MDRYEELKALFKQCAEELGVEIDAWDTDPFSVSIKDRCWDFGEMIRSFGETASLFDKLTPHEKVLAYSINIHLDGEGWAFHQLEDKEVRQMWTLPQQQIVEKAGEIFDGFLSDAKEYVNKLDAFFFAERHESAQVPAALAEVVEEIELTPIDYECVYLDDDRSFDGVEHPAEVMDDVIAGTWKIATVTFVAENGDEIGTNGPVAWPVEHEEQYLTELFAKLGAVPEPALTIEAGGL